MKRSSHQLTQNPEKRMNLRLPNPEKLFPFKSPMSIEGCWMIGLTNLEVCNSVFSVTGENNKFELYIFPDSKKRETTSEKVRHGLEKHLEILDITATALQR